MFPIFDFQGTNGRLQMALLLVDLMTVEEQEADKWTGTLKFFSIYREDLRLPLVLHADAPYN